MMKNPAWRQGLKKPAAKVIRIAETDYIRPVDSLKNVTEECQGKIHDVRN